MVREGIALILSANQTSRSSLGPPAVEAVAMFGAISRISLMDLRLKAMSGVEAICAIRREDWRAHYRAHDVNNDEDIHQALAAGATYLLKEALPDDRSHGARRPCRRAFSGSGGSVEAAR